MREPARAVLPSSLALCSRDMLRQMPALPAPLREVDERRPNAVGGYQPAFGGFVIYRFLKVGAAQLPDWPFEMLCQSGFELPLTLGCGSQVRSKIDTGIEAKRFRNSHLGGAFNLRLSARFSSRPDRVMAIPCFNAQPAGLIPGLWQTDGRILANRKPALLYIDANLQRPGRNTAKLQSRYCPIRQLNAAFLRRLQAIERPGIQLCSRDCWGSVSCEIWCNDLRLT